MIEIIVDSLLLLMAAYLAIGILFSVYFLFSGVNKMDSEVSGSPWHFKLIIWPGTVLLWSVLFVKMIRK